jgi:hypothetical protein
MPSEYFINAESGDSIEGRTVHDERDCADDAGDGHARPIGDSHVDGETDRCPDCAGGSDDPATCDAVKSDGDICGRSRPCRYHDD